MANLSQALSVALSGLRTSSSLISLAANNISNASTPGYSDKKANVSSIDFATQGGGVSINSYSRSADAALAQSYNSATSDSSYYGTLNSYMQQVQTVLDSTSTNPTLSSDISNFASAWNSYAASPESSIQQQSVISAGKTLASDINSITANVSSLDSQVKSDTSTTITSLNSELKQLAVVNNQISAATAKGVDSTDLQDQRDQLVNQVSSYLSLTTQSRPNGLIAIYSAGGQLLVDGGVAEQFTYDGTNVRDPSGTTINGSLTGGSLQAQLDFRDSSQASSPIAGVGTIAKLKSQLSIVVSAFVNPTGSSSSVFANTYSAAATASTAAGAAQNGQQVDSNFFTATYNNGAADSSTFSVNSNLLNSTSALPQTNVQAIANAFTATANYTGSGLSANGVTYAQLGSQVLSNFQLSANTLSSQSTTYASQQSYYKTTLTNSTGVNLDTELANLVTYQSSYAASAHVISTVNQMLTTLMQTI